MRANAMRKLPLLASTLLLIAGLAQAAEVYVTRDAKGNPVYTDRPESMPAEKVGIRSRSTDDAAIQAQTEQQAKDRAAADKAAADKSKQAADAAKVVELSAEDKAKRCQDARANYQNMMNARRIYEPGSTPEERRYLDSAEIDAARADAKKVMDEFCAGQ
jgi:hypothetical protein